MAFDWSAFIQTAKAETHERLQSLNDGLLRLESEAENRELLDEVFRHAHSIKGAARMVGLDLVGRVAHGLEDLLGAIRAGQVTVSSTVLDLGFRALDMIQQLLLDPPPEDSPARAEELVLQLKTMAAGQPVADAGVDAAGVEEDEEGDADAEPLGASDDDAPLAGAEAPGVGGAGAPVTGARPEAPAHSGAVRAETIRVPTEKVDRLLALVGELMTVDEQELALSEGLRALNGRMRGMQTEVNELGGVIPPEEVLLTVRSLREQITELARVSRRLVSMRSIQFREIRDAAMDLRLLPASTLFDRFPRPVRDLARAAGKEVRLIVEGQETRLDKRVLDELYDPLLHLLRNAIDHGIESPAERSALGKQPTGSILLRAVPRGRQVLLQVSDDGRGIDVGKVRNVACDRAWLTPAEAAALPDDQALELLFRPGFSTSDRITEVSGRGVGLDVVRNNVRNLKGMVRVETQPIMGTTFVMEIPLTVATTRVLLLECGSWVYAVPGGLVRGVISVAPEEVRSPHGQPTALWEGHAVPLVDLAGTLGIPSSSKGAPRPAVLLQYASRVVGLLTDRLIGEQEVVLKPLGGMLRRARLVSAGAILGDGRIAFLLYPDAVLAAGLEGRVRVETTAMRAGERPRAVLLADDTLTTREVERAILEAGGYEVVAARDGQEALDRLSERSFDLVVSDIEMPRLDGITLTRLISSDARTAHIPVVIISSFTNEDDKRRGLEAGAAAYIVKSAFDQENLLDLIERLMR